DRCDTRVQADRGRIDALGDRAVERRAMHDVALSSHPPEGTLEVDLGELLSALVADPKASKGAGVAVELPRDTDRSEGAYRVREKAQTCAHLAESHRTLQHEHRNVQTLQGSRQRHAA